MITHLTINCYSMLWVKTPEHDINMAHFKKGVWPLSVYPLGTIIAPRNMMFDSETGTYHIK